MKRLQHFLGLLVAKLERNPEMDWLEPEERWQSWWMHLTEKVQAFFLYLSVAVTLFLIAQVLCWMLAELLEQTFR